MLPIYILITACFTTEDEAFLQQLCSEMKCSRCTDVWPTAKKLSSQRPKTPSTRSSTPEVGMRVTIKPIKILDYVPDFLPNEAEFARAPSIEKQTIILGESLGEGRDGMGFKLNEDVFIKIFKGTRVSNLEELYQEFKTQYIASIFAWIYSKNPMNKFKIAYLMPSLVIIGLHGDQNLTYYGCAMRFLPTFLDSKTTFIENKTFKEWTKFSKWVNEASDFVIWDDQGYYELDGYCYMTDAQIHPDRRLITSPEEQINYPEILPNRSIQKLAVKEAFRCVIDEIRKRLEV